MEKVLVTGVSGYLGACIFNRLNKTKSAHMLKCRLEEIKRCSLEYDLVIHCAGALRYRVGHHKIANAEGTRKLIKGLKTNSKIIYISSKSIYGFGFEGNYTEQSPPQPLDDYGISKYEGELEVLKSGFPFIIIRPSTLFGLGVNNLGRSFPSIAMKQLYQGKDVSLFIPDVLHEYLYVNDLATMVKKLVDIPDSWNNVFNASGPKRSLHALINTIQSCLKLKIASIGKINKISKEPHKSFFIDSSKLENIIGKEIYTPDEVIIDRMVEFLKNRIK